MSIDEQMKESEYQLNNQEHYKKLKKDPGEKNLNLTNDATHRLKETS